MGWHCLAAFLCSAVLQCSGVHPQFKFSSLSSLPETYDSMKKTSKHIDYYIIGKTDGGLDIPVLLVSKDVRERSLIGVPKICFFSAVSQKEAYSRDLMLKIISRFLDGKSHLHTSILSEFALHSVLTLGISDAPADFNGLFDSFPAVFLESEPPKFALVAAEWLIKTRCLVTILFGGFGRGVAIPFFSDPADIGEFNAAGHVIRDRIEFEERIKKNRNPTVKDYDEDYDPPEDDGSDIPDIPVEYPPAPSFLTLADRNRTRRSSASFRSDGDGPRVLSSETTEDNKTWAQRKSRDMDRTSSGKSTTGAGLGLNGNKNGGDAMTRRHGNSGQSLDNSTSADDGAYGKAKRSLEFPGGRVWRPRDRKMGFRGKRPDRRPTKKPPKKKEPKKEPEKEECRKDPRRLPLPSFVAPDHDDLVYLASKFTDALQSIHYPQCGLDSVTICFPVNNTVFTGRTWRYVAGSMADFAYMKAGTLPITIFAYCAKDVTGFGLAPNNFDQLMDGLTSLILSSRYGVRGIVKNTKGEPLNNVSYTVLGREQIVMTTSDNGEYSRLLTGKYIIQFRKDGYRLVNQVVDIQKSEVVKLNVTMFGVNERIPGQDKDEPKSGHSTPALTVAPLLAGLLSYVVSVVIVRHGD